MLKGVICRWGWADVIVLATVAKAFGEKYDDVAWVIITPVGLRMRAAWR